MEDGPTVLQEEVAGARRPAELHQQLHGPPRRPRPGLRRLVRRQLGLQCNGESESERGVCQNFQSALCGEVTLTRGFGPCPL